jgi:hypothetical protein
MKSHFGHRTLKLAAASALALGLTTGAGNSQAASASATATATVVNPIGISKNSDLIFGKFAAGNGGTVAVSPGGVRSKTGGVTLLTAASGLAASFNITGSDNASYGITLPSNGTIQIPREGGAETMAIKDFQSQPANAGTLNGSGNQITVNASLTAVNNQMVGSYAGSFAVIVDYN